MRIGAVMICFAISAAFGQTKQDFPLTQNENKEEMREIASILRVLSGIEHISVDEDRKNLTVEGTPAQIAIARWLIQQIDQPVQGDLAGTHEYRSPDAGDDVVRVFYVSNIGTPKGMQEIATILRLVANIRRLFVFDKSGAVVVRGSNEQVQLAAWLMDQINQPANVVTSVTHEYKLSGGETARVFELTHDQTPEEMQEIAMLIRTIGDIPKSSVYQQRRMLALRTTTEQVRLAAWLIDEVDKAAPTEAAHSQHEYHLADGSDNLVEIFYLAGSKTVANKIRVAANVRRVCVYNKLLAVRGTVDEMAAVKQLLAAN